MGQSRSRRILLPALLFLAAEGVLLALGGWQVRRLEWKNALLAALDEAAAHPSPDLNFAGLEGGRRHGRIALYGTIHGRFVADRAFLVGPRTHDGESGFNAYVPFRLREGGYVLVNRGWVPGPRRENIGGGEESVPGFARMTDRPNPFMPPNDPAKGAWFYADPVSMAREAKAEPVSAYIFYASEGSDSFPYPPGLGWRPPNDHFGYAVFWFSSAALLAGLTALRMRAGRHAGRRA